MSKYSGYGSFRLQCNECGKIFKKKFKQEMFEVTCPKCKSTDVEVIG